VTQDDDCYSSALQQAIKLGYFITEVVCSNVASYEEGSYDAEYREHVDNAITAFCDFPGLTKLTLDGFPSLSERCLILSRRSPTFMSLLDINVQADTESDLDLQDMVDNAEEIVMMEAAGVRMNVSFEVQNDDEDDVLCTPSTWVPDLKRSRDDVSDDEPAAKR
jgi:hypothetical protein